MSTFAAPASTMLAGWEPTEDKLVKRVRCGECRGCLGEDCGTCANCADKPKFGGQGKAPSEMKPLPHTQIAIPRAQSATNLARKPSPCPPTSPAGIKKQACHARRCILVKTSAPEIVVAPTPNNSVQAVTAVPSMFSAPAGFRDFNEVRARRPIQPPPPRARPCAKAQGYGCLWRGHPRNRTLSCVCGLKPRVRDDCARRLVLFFARVAPRTLPLRARRRPPTLHSRPRMRPRTSKHALSRCCCSPSPKWRPLPDLHAFCIAHAALRFC